MRGLVPFAALAALAFAHTAFANTAAAEPVALSGVTLSAELQTKIDEDYGAREAAYLQRTVADEVAESLADAGAQITHTAPVTVDVQIVDARPNRPTFEQLGATPGLDYFGSISSRSRCRA